MSFSKATAEAVRVQVQSITKYVGAEALLAPFCYCHPLSYSTKGGLHPCQTIIKKPELIISGQNAKKFFDYGVFLFLGGKMRSRHRV